MSRSLQTDMQERTSKQRSVGQQRHQAWKESPPRLGRGEKFMAMETGVRKGTMSGQAFYAVILEANTCGKAAAAGGFPALGRPVQGARTFHSGPG